MSTTTTPPVRFRTWTSALPVSCERGHVAYVYSYDPRAQLEAMKREQDLDTLNFSPDGETGWEVWGTRQGKQFKLRLLLDLPAHVLELDADDRALWIAWQDCGGIEQSTIDEAKEALVGIYRDEKEAGQTIGEEQLSSDDISIPWWICVDWEATWECNLRHPFSSTTHDGQFYVFRQ